MSDEQPTERLTIGSRLKVARVAAGYSSVRKLCAEHGLSVGTVAAHESGRANPKPSALKKYAEILGVDWLWLLTGEDQQQNFTPTGVEPIAVPVVSWASASNFAEAEPEASGQKVYIAANQSSSLVALRVRGSSMNSRRLTARSSSWIIAAPSL